MDLEYPLDPLSVSNSEHITASPVGFNTDRVEPARSLLIDSSIRQRVGEHWDAHRTFNGTPAVFAVSATRTLVEHRISHVCTDDTEAGPHTMHDDNDISDLAEGPCRGIPHAARRMYTTHTGQHGSRTVHLQPEAKLTPFSPHSLL